MLLMWMGLGLALADGGACAEGQQTVDGEHCCWPGQSWYPEPTGCVGVPKTCPAGQESFEFGCFDVNLNASEPPRGPSDLRFGLGAVTAEGARKPDEIRDALGRVTGPVRLCFLEATAEDPGVAGALTLTFEVTPKGRVRRVEVTESTVGAVAVEACLVEEVRGLRLGEAEGETAVKTRVGFGR